MAHTKTPQYLSKGPKGIYYFRYALSSVEKAQLRQRELHWSLRTMERQDARRLALTLHGRITNLLARGRVMNIRNSELRKHLEELRDYFIRDEIQKFDTDGPLTSQQRQSLRERIRTRKLELRMQLPPNYIVDEAKLIVKELEITGGEDALQKVAFELLKMLIAADEEFLDQTADFDSYRLKPAGSIIGTPMGTGMMVSTAASGEALSELIEAFCNEKCHEDSWKPKTAHENRAIYRVLTRVLGDLPLRDITGPVARSFKETLVKLPPNMNKTPRYKDLEIGEILRLSEVTPMTVRTVNKYLSRISELFEWAIRNNYIERNHFKGLKLKKSRADRDAKLPFSDDDLLAIFNATSYRKFTKRPHLNWGPLLALYTGARRGEIAQLRLGDIYQENGVWVADINEHGSSTLKTSAANRKIPIHQDLIDLGFIEYCEDLKAKGKQYVFSHRINGTHISGRAIGDSFNRYLRKEVGIETKSKTLHSLRHTLSQHLKEASVPQPEIAAIMGHADPHISTGLYGTRYSPSVLHKAISKMDFRRFIADLIETDDNNS